MAWHGRGMAWQGKVTEADLRLCFAYAKSRFSHNEAHIVSVTFCFINKFEETTPIN